MLFLISLFPFAESFTKTNLGEEVINESGVCQNCFIRFNEYDEHFTLAEQIESELVSLMDNKIYTVDYDQEPKVKIEDPEDHSATDPIEYEPFETSECNDLFLTGDDEEEVEDETVVEAIEEDFHYEIVVDDTKENVRHRSVRTALEKQRAKDTSNEFIVIEMDDNQKVYQCDICMKTCKDKSKLRSHREIHTEERNVICPVCPRSFDLNSFN